MINANDLLVHLFNRQSALECDLNDHDGLMINYSVAVKNNPEVRTETPDASNMKAMTRPDK